MLVGPACPALTSGGANICVGNAAGLYTTTGSGNTFVGNGAGVSNIGGKLNTFYGLSAGYSNISGNYNTFIGMNSGFYSNSDYNIALGTLAGVNNTGSNTIYIGNQGTSTSESNSIHIGNQNDSSYFLHTAAYIAGIYNGSAGQAPAFNVCVDDNGKLWGVPALAPCIVSSRRFKEHVLDMGDSSSKLFQLRPVTFFYKPQYDDGSHQLQYGLIAEEVASVYPEMVVNDRDGQPYTVKYQLLAPMLLNELQKQHAVVSMQQDVIQSQQQQINDLQQRLSRLESLIANK